jgi:hypothetical protein
MSTENVEKIAPQAASYGADSIQVLEGLEAGPQKACDVYR